MNAKQTGVNIYELAKASGYSPSTVSKAINNTGRISEKTRQFILKIAAEMHYVASYHAKALSQKKSWLIAVIFSDNLASGFSHPYFSVILEHFKRRIEENGYEITFINRNMANTTMTYLEFCKHRNVDGVFMVNAYSLSRQIPELIASGIPIVTADAGNLNIPTITSDDLSGGRLAAEYLTDLGHEKVYHIAGPQYTLSGQRRLNGFTQVMNERNTEYKIYVADNYGYEDGYKQAMEIINSESLPTAVFAAGDWMALGAMKAFHDNNIHVPNDISVIGYDDLDFVQFMNPPLTTISQRKEEIGYACADFLLSSIAGEEVEAVTLEVQVVERETCKSVK